MAYVKGLAGVSWADVNRSAKGVISTIGGTLDAAKVILEDPALPEVTYLVLRLNKLEQKPGETVRGVGLNKVVTPLKVYVAAREKPILGYAILAGILGLPFLAGYFTGKR